MKWRWRTARSRLCTIVAWACLVVAHAQGNPSATEAAEFDFVWDAPSGVEAVVATTVHATVRPRTSDEGDGALLQLTFESVPEVGDGSVPATYFSSYVASLDLGLRLPRGLGLEGAEVQAFDVSRRAWVSIDRLTAGAGPANDVQDLSEGGPAPDGATLQWRIGEVQNLDLGRFTGFPDRSRFRLRVTVPLVPAPAEVPDEGSLIEVETAFSERHFQYVRTPERTYRLAEPGTRTTRRSARFGLALSDRNIEDVAVIGATASDFSTAGGSFEVSVSPRRADGSTYLGALDRGDFEFRDIHVTPADAPDERLASGEVNAIEVRSVAPSRGAEASVVLVLDSSGSMSDNDPERLRVDASLMLLERLDPTDRAAVLDFGAGTSSGLRASRRLQDFTGDPRELDRAVSRVAQDGSTPLYASMLDAIELLEDIDAAAKAVVVLTDGEADQDDAEPTRVVARANATDVTVYALGLGSGLDFGELQRLASSTGGTFAEASEASRLARAFDGLGRGLREGRTVVTARGRLLPRLEDAGTYGIAGELVTTAGSRHFTTPFSFTLEVADAQAPELPRWMTLPHPAGGTVEVHSDLPEDRARPMNLQGLAGRDATFQVFESGVHVADEADVAAYVQLLLDTLNARGFVRENRAHSRVRDSAGPPRERPVDPPYDVPHPPLSRTGQAYVFEGGNVGLPGIETRGLDDPELRATLWRDTILSIAFRAEFAEGLSEDQRRRYQRAETTTGRDLLLHAARALEGHGERASATVTDVQDLGTAARTFQASVEWATGTDGLLRSVARALDRATMHVDILRRHGQTTIGMFTGARRYTYFQRLERHLGRAADGLTVAQVVLKLQVNAFEAFTSVLSANAVADARLGDLERLAEQGPCRPGRRDDPAFCEGLTQARHEFEALQGSVAQGLANAFLSAEDYLDYGTIVASVTEAISRHYEWYGGAHFAHGLGSTVFTYRQFHSLSDEGEQLRRAHLIAQLDHWLATDGEVPDPRVDGDPNRWQQSLRWADLHAYGQWAYFDALEDAYTGSWSEGLGPVMLQWMTRWLKPGSDDAIEHLQAQRERAAAWVLSEARAISDRVGIELR